MTDIRHVPLRTCLATGQKLPRRQLLRFVNVRGVPTPDPSGTAPGRGAYVTPSEEALALAVKKKGFAHKLRTNKPPPPWQEVLQILDTARHKGHKAAEIEG